MILAYIAFHAMCAGVCISIIQRTMKCPSDANGYSGLSILIGPIMLIILFAYHKAESYSPEFKKMQEQIKGLEDKVFDKTIKEYK